MTRAIAVTLHGRPNFSKATLRGAGSVGPAQISSGRLRPGRSERADYGSRKRRSHGIVAGPLVPAATVYLPGDINLSTASISVPPLSL
jgi:hypothetical protein